MLTRKENLLLRPWQQRKFENHRRKVQSATAVVDNRPPEPRKHVELKLKQLQREKERCQQIENDNLLLLRKLSHIMKTSRVDNWTVQQPNFLSRVNIYASKIKQKPVDEHDVPQHIFDNKNRRKLRCLACTPHKPEPPKIPEERVPWEPVKLPVSKTSRSKSVPIRKIEPLPTIQEKSPQSPASKKSSAKSVRAEYKSKKINLNLSNNAKSPQSITISKGALKLAVNFPSDAFVKLKCGRNEKPLMGELCHCRGFAPNAVMCQ